MNRHSSAEDKLHVAKQLRQQLKDRQLSLQQKSRQESLNSKAPPKGTNTNNQYR